MRPFQQSVEIALSWAHMRYAAMIGNERTFSAIKNKRKFRGPKKREVPPCDTYTQNINGCIAEYAVAREFSMFWDGALGNLDAKDVGGLIEVRHGTWFEHDLCLHPEDDDEDPFVSVLVDGVRCVLHGWAFAKEGKIEGYWRDGTKDWPAFWMPREKLRPMSELHDWVDQKQGKITC